MISPNHLIIDDLRTIRDKVQAIKNDNYKMAAPLETYPWNAPCRRLHRIKTELETLIGELCQPNRLAKTADVTKQ